MDLPRTPYAMLTSTSKHALLTRPRAMLAQPAIALRLQGLSALWYNSKAARFTRTRWRY